MASWPRRPDVERHPVHAKVVVLTLDAGANADGVASILGTLSQEHLPARFLLTGNFTSSFGAQAKAMAATGRMGDHAVSHPYFTKLTDAQIRQQVLIAQQTIKSQSGADPAPWFRFPYGGYNAHTVSVVNSAGFVRSAEPWIRSAVRARRGGSPWQRS
jgi:peptidoglycan/xylan/chitin deacetylase (PgdA/CDA1 family)